MRNAAASPYRYLMDPDEQLRVLLEIDDADEVVWAIVHSHVASPPRPSATDVGLATYPDALYLHLLVRERAARPARLDHRRGRRQRGRAGTGLMDPVAVLHADTRRRLAA